MLLRYGKVLSVRDIYFCKLLIRSKQGQQSCDQFLSEPRRIIALHADRDKVRQRGSGAESRARALRADQGLHKLEKLESNSEPERARVSQ